MVDLQGETLKNLPSSFPAPVQCQCLLLGLGLCTHLNASIAGVLSGLGFTGERHVFHNCFVCNCPVVYRKYCSLPLALTVPSSMNFLSFPVRGVTCISCLEPIISQSRTLAYLLVISLCFSPSCKKALICRYTSKLFF